VDRANWAGTYSYRAERVHRPASVEEAQEIVASARRIRVLGSRHSFTGIADSDELLSLDALPSQVTVDGAARTVTLGGRTTYGELADVLGSRGLALANLASLPHISVAGAVATASHGSGDRNGNLATSVAGLELIGADGELIRIARGEPEFDGFVVGLGALGAMLRVALDVEPAYEIAQCVYEHLPWETLLEHFDEITASGYSVSAFTLWRGDIEQVWVKARVDDGHTHLPETLFGASAATVEHHPIPGVDPVNCTPQLGVPGPWSERVPHFRMGFTPSAGAEIQTEYLVPRAHATAAIEALRPLAGMIAPLIQTSELRTVAADRLWMSPQHGTDTVGIHFTWRREPEAVRAVLEPIEAALAPFGARPHWGKLFLARAATLAPLYPRHGDFIDLVERNDPDGTFRNEWFEQHVLRG
jgi:xylitol oxidase